jgi:two-component system, sensor histidine kinase
VRRLSAVLNHSLRLRSVPGRGSCFQMLLSHIEPPAAASEPLFQPEDHTLLRGRVLVVDDYELVRESLVQTLLSWGLFCDAASDGDQALALAGQHVYDAVLCDWRLSGTRNGVDVLEAIRLQQLPDALLVLITGEPAESLGKLPEDIVVLYKPIRPIRLRALLMAHLAKRVTPPLS